MGRKRTLEEFIRDAIAVHGNKYGYDNVVYVNAKTEVIITCPIHGDFPILPSNHTNLKQGCPDCAREAKADSLEEFITKARAKHGDKYNYDKVKYINDHTLVTITCQIHGDFQQMPHSHKNGCGCPKCKKEKISKALSMTKEKFIEEAKTIHAGKYNYDNVEYVNNKTPVTITCPIHGNFPQTPHAHKNGQGCPWCKSSHLERETRNLLKKNNISFESQKKFMWLKNKGQMPLDFYLPNYNVAIECQGIQHYESSGIIYTEEKVKTIKERDILKKTLCEEHGIPVYYINYNENVEEKINDLINELNENNRQCYNKIV